MAIRVVQLGTPRRRGEGLRLGTVRRPPRGVSSSRFARDDWYDVWLPQLAPSAALMKAVRSRNATWWQTFSRRYVAEMNQPDTKRLLMALAALSTHAHFSVGCYCEDERHCHRSLLRRLLDDHGAVIVG